jgi:hypothetical protein
MQLRRIAIAALAAAVMVPSVATAAGQYYYERDREVRREIREGAVSEEP